MTGLAERETYYLRIRTVDPGPYLGLGVVVPELGRQDVVRVTHERRDIGDYVQVVVQVVEREQRRDVERRQRVARANGRGPGPPGG